MEFNKIKLNNVFVRGWSGGGLGWKAIKRKHNFHRNCFLSVSIKHTPPSKKESGRKKNGSSCIQGSVKYTIVVLVHN